MRFLLDPINSIASTGFYRQVARQRLGRSILYIGYLSAIFSVALGFSVKTRVIPQLHKEFSWLIRELPTLKLADGKLSSPSKKPLVIQDPENPALRIAIDTSRTDPVPPQILESQRLRIYLTADSAYILRSNGVIQVLDFARLKGSAPLIINKAFLEQADALFSGFILVALVAVVFVGLSIWKIAATFLYSLAAMGFNSAYSAQLPYSALFNISLYAQTLNLLAHAAFFLLPWGSPPFSAPLALVSTMIYIALAVKANAPPPQAAPAAQPPQE